MMKNERSAEGSEQAEDGGMKLNKTALWSQKPAGNTTHLWKAVWRK